MHIEIKDLNGKHVTNVATNPMILSSTIEEVKKKYPKGQYHATLVTF